VCAVLKLNSLFFLSSEYFDFSFESLNWYELFTFLVVAAVFFSFDEKLKRDDGCPLVVELKEKSWLLVVFPKSSVLGWVLLGCDENVIGVELKEKSWLLIVCDWNDIGVELNDKGWAFVDCDPNIDVLAGALLIWDGNVIGVELNDEDCAFDGCKLNSDVLAGALLIWDGNVIGVGLNDEGCVFADCDSNSDVLGGAFIVSRPKSINWLFKSCGLIDSCACEMVSFKSELNCPIMLDRLSASTDGFFESAPIDLESIELMVGFVCFKLFVFFGLIINALGDGLIFGFIAASVILLIDVLLLIFFLNIVLGFIRDPEPWFSPFIGDIIVVCEV